MSDEREHRGQGDKPADDDDGRSVLSRWSRRKAAVRAGLSLEEAPEALLEAPRADALPATIPDAADAEATDAEDALPADAETAPLPALTELDDDSDYSAFLREKVPAVVRKQALRQLFSAAKFNIVDGLDDYDDDFRQILPLGDIVTSDMKHQIEVQAQKAKEKAEEEARKAALAKEEDADEEETKALEADEAQAIEGDVEALDADAESSSVGATDDSDTDAGSDSGSVAPRRASGPAMHRGLRPTVASPASSDSAAGNTHTPRDGDKG